MASTADDRPARYEGCKRQSQRSSWRAEVLERFGKSWKTTRTERNTRSRCCATRVMVGTGVARNSMLTTISQTVLSVRNALQIGHESAMRSSILHRFHIGKFATLAAVHRRAQTGFDFALRMVVMRGIFCLSRVRFCCLRHSPRAPALNRQTFPADAARCGH